MKFLKALVKGVSARFLRIPKALALFLEKDL
jgi:hypothetical protein